jgi:aminoglycoside phosphotransferase (APT) family kinase protein
MSSTLTAPAAATETDLARSEADRFDEALQPRLMGPRLGALSGDGSLTCHVLDAKYEPGVRAVVLYEHAGRLLRGDLLSGSGDQSRDAVGPATIVAPGVRICSFPMDPELPALATVMDPVRLGPVLADALHRQPEALDLRGPVRCRTTLLRYRPGKRATVRVAFVGHADRFVAKAYHDPAKALAVADEAHGLGVPGAGRTLRFAPTVAHCPELGVVVQRAVEGTALDVLIGATRGSGPAVRQALSSAARALAELHDLSSVTSRHRSVERELRRFVARAAGIGSVAPELGAEAGQLADRLLSVHADLPAPRTGMVHGDCKPSQFRLTGQQVYLMDLDHLGVSDQAADVGTFLASLRQLAVRDSVTGGPAGPSDRVTELSQLFLGTYLEAQGHDQTLTRIHWQVAVALERKALRAFARAPRSPVARALVREANRCLDAL